MSVSGLALCLRRISSEAKELCDKAEAREMIPYPWSGLEDSLREAGESHLRLVGYGSLVNAESASATIAEASANQAAPVIAHGVRRIFNYEMDPSLSRYLSPDNPRARALLNAECGEIGITALNGVLLEIRLDDLPALREREADYDLAPVVCEPWGGGNGEASLAWVLVCSPVPGTGPARVNNELIPNPDYYRVCREGAASFGEDFLDAWLESTFLGDGRTSMREWEAADSTGRRSYL